MTRHVPVSRVAVWAILSGLYLGAAQAAETLTIGKAMQRALVANPSIRSLEAEVEKQGLEKEIAHGQRLPKVDLNAGYTSYAYPTLVTPIREAGVFPPFDRNVFNIGVALSLPLYTGGRLVAGQSLAQHKREAAVHGLTSAGQDLLFNVAATYTKALHLRDLQRAGRSRIDTLETQESHLSQRLAEGRAAKLELIRLQTQLSQARHDLLVLEQGERDAMALLATLLGESRKLPPLSDVASGVPVLLYSRDEAMARAARQRPDLLQAQILQKAASAGVDIARSEQKPQVSLVAGAQETAGAGDLKGYGTGQIGVQISLPLFDGSIRKNRVEQARLEERKGQLQVSHVQNQIASDIEQALGAVAESASRVEVALQGEREAAEALRIETARYQAGQSTVTDLLGAESALWSARGNRLQAGYDVITSRARLLRAMGELSTESFAPK